MKTIDRLGLGPVANALATAISVVDPDPSSSAPLLMKSRSSNGFCGAACGCVALGAAPACARPAPAAPAPAAPAAPAPAAPAPAAPAPPGRPPPAPAAAPAPPPRGAFTGV